MLLRMNYDSVRCPAKAWWVLCIAVLLFVIIFHTLIPAVYPHFTIFVTTSSYEPLALHRNLVAELSRSQSRRAVQIEGLGNRYWAGEAILAESSTFPFARTSTILQMLLDGNL
jgi:hypothetical protein